MIKFFRHIRQRLLTENPPSGRAGNFSKYLLYAIGEIVLVVIGILIALQINNSNNTKLDNDREIKYLTNIKLDLAKYIESLEHNIDFRLKKTKGIHKLIDEFN